MTYFVFGLGIEEAEEAFDTEAELEEWLIARLESGQNIGGLVFIKGEAIRVEARNEIYVKIGD